jgi:hypothetical protein
VRRRQSRIPAHRLRSPASAHQACRNWHSLTTLRPRLRGSDRRPVGAG